ncbi:hypothetical protein CO165_03860 [Candidatus Roizmanbacteria bacterium CG_4_9_14_3_um_filter_33_18]|uniref:YCII-related domain-containing protein n=2 Tax=Candidatus Roizmaniibacteriota TaxID=1752723 RepID=A0A2M7XXC1_9BACT|nr:MAG: hypothetical protein COW97_01165 [Candidatus Roizmanbacteria bacterium CG22_combo_CG10-13_8_21_14_all_34_12]PJA55377.1 MAG: hypothetical protein CO165_03860 [Candidatus Roizmanbacteria bacterium CG_4_9_14_3_um_filter_33_18]
MKYFVITYIHADIVGWKKYLPTHVFYLHKLSENGTLVISGPFISTPHKSAMFILLTDSQEKAIKLIKKDPLMIHGLVSEYTIAEWNPIFGAFELKKNK